MSIRNRRRSSGSRTRWCLLAASLALAGTARNAGAQSIKIEFDGGRVNLIAKDAQVRQILAEWARLGGTQIINGDKVTGPPVSIELMGVDERRALDVILRNASGYMVSSRVAVAGKSIIDKVHIVPTSSAPLPRAVAAIPTPQTVPPPIPQDEDEQEDPPPSRPAAAGRGAPARPPPVATRNPITNRQPPATDPDPVEEEEEEEPDPPPPATTPGNPFGVPTGSTRPGEISKPPQPQNRPGQPAAPGQPTPAPQR
jgi:hypothetical protein